MYAGKAVGIQSMTKNPNPGILFFSLVFVCVWRSDGVGISWIGVGMGVGAIIFICDTLYYSNTHCFKFSSRYSIALPSYCLHKNTLRNLLKGCNSKNKKTV